jgi:hypothetical protein
MAIEPFSVPCACNSACKGSWSLPEQQFCRWNNPSKAVDWDTQNGVVSDAIVKRACNCVSRCPSELCTGCCPCCRRTGRAQYQRGDGTLVVDKRVAYWLRKDGVRTALTLQESAAEIARLQEIVAIRRIDDVPALQGNDILTCLRKWQHEHPLLRQAVDALEDIKKKQVNCPVCKSEDLKSTPWPGGPDYLCTKCGAHFDWFGDHAGAIL